MVAKLLEYQARERPQKQELTDKREYVAVTEKKLSKAFAIKGSTLRQMTSLRNRLGATFHVSTVEFLLLFRAVLSRVYLFVAPSHPCPFWPASSMVLCGLAGQCTKSHGENDIDFEGLLHHTFLRKVRGLPMQDDVHPVEGVKNSICPNPLFL